VGFAQQVRPVQYQRRFILIGTRNEIARLKHELKLKADASIEVVAN